MKLRVVLIILALTTMFFSCGKKESSPTAPKNAAPELAGIGNQSVTPGQTKDLALCAADADGDSLSFSIPTNPGFLSITGFSQLGDTAIATLVIAPEDTITGSFNATVQVSDGRGGVDSESFTIEVAEPSILTKIVFKSDRSGNWDIWVMNSDGSNQTQLTIDQAADFAPAFSPDGSKIVFVSERGGNGDIWVMNSDGSNPVQLTTDPADDDAPAFSPDGNKIVFESKRSGNYDIWLMNLDGSDKTQLTTDSADEWFPTFSPEGNKIAFTSTRSGEGDIYLMNIDGSSQTRLSTKQTYGEWFPNFSPDGTKIVFTAVSSTLWLDIYVINIDGTNETRLTYGGDNMDANFSPDGTKMAFASSRSGNYDIWVMSASGDDEVQLTTHPDKDMAPDWHE
ncbi:MAG: PD40 domain-containing protein [candidate division Zixibacteria bacterium]|nr:PD40 domain-containing protein [candidate division Zixibacteria bacterium]